MTADRIPNQMSAADAYREQIRTLFENINAIQAKVAAHRNEQRKDRNSWAYVGDVSYWNEVLRRIVEEE